MEIWESGVDMEQSRQMEMSKGQEAYHMRVELRTTWSSIALELNFATHRGAMTSAQTYAVRNRLPWPVNGFTKGEAIYRTRKIGVPWQLISNRYDQTIDQIKRLAYKYAYRHEKPWPPAKGNNNEY